MAGPVLDEIFDPVTAHQIFGVITGMGDDPSFSHRRTSKKRV
jgi:hypothetical protein